MWPSLSPDLLLLYFFSRDDCSVANRAQLTHWKRTLEMKSVKLTAWHLNAVSTTCNTASRYTWRRMVVTFSTLCNPWQWSRDFCKDLLIYKGLWPSLSPDLLLLYFFSRDDCSVTNRTLLTHWKRTLEMKPVKLTAWHLNAVSTTCNTASTYTWRRMVVYFQYTV